MCEKFIFMLSFWNCMQVLLKKEHQWNAWVDFVYSSFISMLSHSSNLYNLTKNLKNLYNFFNFIFVSTSTSRQILKEVEI